MPDESPGLFFQVAEMRDPRVLLRMMNQGMTLAPTCSALVSDVRPVLRMVDQSFPSAFLQFAFMRGTHMVGQVFSNVAGDTFRGTREDGNMRKFSTLDAAMCYALSRGDV
jgi:hypothetical protein